MAILLRRAARLMAAAIIPAALLWACSSDSTDLTPGNGSGGGGRGGDDVGGSGGSGAGNSQGGNPGGGGTGGEGGGTGGEGGTPIADTGADGCPGDAYSVSVGTSLRLAGDTSTATNLLSSGAACPLVHNAAAPERVYKLTIQDTGSLKVQVRAANGSTLNPGLYMQLGCGTELSCWDFFKTHEETAIHIGANKQPFLKPPFDLFVIVDGSDDRDGGVGGSGPVPTSGEYLLTVKLTAPKCGDGVINDSETCDDGNTNDLDGCSSSCDVETISIYDTCPGEVVSISPGVHVKVASGTTPYSDDYLASHQVGTTCADTQPRAGGKDRVYKISPTASGTLTVTTGYAEDGSTNICETSGLTDPACWDRVLWATGPNDCGQEPGATQIACDNSTFGVETISFPVVGGSDYHVIVDGYEDSNLAEGPFWLHLDLAAN